MTDERRVEIYALLDPDDGAIRYIGKAVDAAKRLRGHLREHRRQSPLYSWIRKIGRAGKQPVLHIVGTVRHEVWQEAERAAIALCRERGLPLLNLADGGDQPDCSAAVRAENGRKVAKLRPANIMRVYRLAEYNIRQTAKWAPHKVEQRRATLELWRATVDLHRRAGTLAELDRRCAETILRDRPVTPWEKAKAAA